jgi:hypothetical protein
MKKVFYSDTDLSDVSINTAQSCLVKANTTINKNEKIKSLIVASKLIDSTLRIYGVDINRTKIEKGKK